MSKKNAVTYDEMYKYLSNRKSRYAEECSESRKRAIRKFSENIHLEDGVLGLGLMCNMMIRRSIVLRANGSVLVMKRNRSKCCSTYMIIQLVGATSDETRQGTKFLKDISGMGRSMTLMTTSRPVTSAKRYITHPSYPTHYKH